MISGHYRGVVEIMKDNYQSCEGRKSSALELYIVSPRERPSARIPEEDASHRSSVYLWARSVTSRSFTG